MAGVLAAGPDGVLSHRSAATQWQLSTAWTEVIELSSPHGSRQRGLMSHESEVAGDESLLFDAIRVTTVPRTLIDLAEVVPTLALEHAVHQAYRLRRFDRVAVQTCIHRHRGRNGAARLRRLLGDEPAGVARRPDHNLVVETDGRDEHLTPVAFEDDRERDVLLMEADYKVRRFTYRQLTERPGWVAARLEAALRN